MSEPALIHQDDDHLRLLRIFHFVCAGMAALFACFPIIHLIFGLVIVLNPAVMSSGKNPPPAFLGWFFVIFAACFILLGGTYAALVAWAGRCLGRRTSYNFCFVVACVECVFMPFGTVLGVFTILVLLRPSVKSLFNPAASS